MIMADLNTAEKAMVETLFDMAGGYVLDFNNRTFQEFVVSATGKDIEDPKYSTDNSGSKANRLRRFMKIEPDIIVGKLIGELCEHYRAHNEAGFGGVFQGSEMKDKIFPKVLSISERLRRSPQVVELVEVYWHLSDEKHFQMVAGQIRDSIEKNEPEAALDRLHTLLVQFIRELCDKHGIQYEKNNSLNSIFGKYVKHLIDNKYVETEMSQRILKYAINLLEAFNDIRNNNSLAHANGILNYDESLLIFNNLTNLISFINKIESRISSFRPVDDLPF